MVYTVEFSFKEPLLRSDKGLDDDGEDKIKKEELTNNDDGDAIEDANNWEVNVDEVHELKIPSLTSDHLEDCQQGGAEVVEIRDAVVDVTSFWVMLTFERNWRVVFNVSAY